MTFESLPLSHHVNMSTLKYVTTWHFWWHDLCKWATTLLVWPSWWPWTLCQHDLDDYITWPCDHWVLAIFNIVAFVIECEHVWTCGTGHCDSRVHVTLELCCGSFHVINFSGYPFHERCLNGPGNTTTAIFVLTTKLVPTLSPASFDWMFNWILKIAGKPDLLIRNYSDNMKFAIFEFNALMGVRFLTQKS